MITNIVRGVLAVLLAAALVAGGLLFSGARPCADRSSQPSALARASLGAKWLALSLTPVPIAVTEREATSAAAVYIQERDVPVHNVQIHFCSDGTAEATGTLRVLGLPIRVVAKGTIDFSGAAPRILFDKIEAGRLPSAIARPVIEAVLPESLYYPRIPGGTITIVYVDRAANVSGRR